MPGTPPSTIISISGSRFLKIYFLELSLSKGQILISLFRLEKVLA